MIKFDKDKFLKPEIYSTNDERETRCNVTKEIVDDVKQLQQENQELKKKLEENQNPLKGIFAQVNDDTLLRDCGNMNAEIDEIKTQQKEFIEYLENCINELKKESMNKFQNAINLGIVDITKEILSKYKEIIGGKDE